MNSKCQNRNEETDAVRNSLNYYYDNVKGINDILGRNNRIKIKKEDYEKITSFLIPVILTVVLEIIKKLTIFVLKTEASNNNLTLEKAFPMMKIALYTFSAIVFVALFFLVIRLNDYIEKILFYVPNEEEYMKESFLRLKEYGLKFQNNLAVDETKSGCNYVDLLIKTHVEGITLMVAECYEFFKDSFIGIGKLQNEISFEVSFMTKSFIDKEITIVASKNEKDRQPKSMLIRKDEPTIYHGTETYKIYEEYRNQKDKTSEIKIIEDCNNHDGFKILYEDQAIKIRSMAVLPVLSSKNELLGTLVITVNEVGFFKKKYSHFWSELLEIYSTEIGYHYLAIRNCIMLADKQLSDDSKKPF